MIKAFWVLLKSLPWPAKITTILMFTSVPIVIAFALLALFFALLVNFYKWMLINDRLNDTFWRKTFLTTAYLFGFADILLNYTYGSVQFHELATWDKKTYSQRLNGYKVGWRKDMAQFMGIYIINKIAKNHIKAR